MLRHSVVAQFARRVVCFGMIASAGEEALLAQPGTGCVGVGCPPDHCESGLRDASGQCCAVGEEVVDGVCTVRVVAPPGDAIGDFCANPGNWGDPICGGSGNGGGGAGGGNGGGGAGGGGGGDAYDSVIDDFLSDFPQWATLTDAEKQFIRDYPLVAWAFAKDAEDAIAEARQRFPTGGANDDHDAFRHALWNALMAYSHGVPLALQFSDAHENFPTNPAGEKAMDLHNNGVGASIGDLAAFLGQPGTVDALSSEVYAAWEKGWLMTSPPE